MAYIEYEKPFDYLLSAVVSVSLKGQGINVMHTNLLGDIKGIHGKYNDPRESDKFPIRKRVRKEDISPKLFTACLVRLFRNLDWGNIGLRTNGEFVSHLRFADDIALLSETAERMQAMLRNHQKARPWG